MSVADFFFVKSDIQAKKCLKFYLSYDARHNLNLFGSFTAFLHKLTLLAFYCCSTSRRKKVKEMRMRGSMAILFLALSTEKSAAV